MTTIECLNLSDPRVSGLGAWFEKLSTANGIISKIYDLLTQRWNNCKSAGNRAISARILSGKPLEICVVNGIGYLSIKCEHRVKTTRGTIEDRSCSWAIAAPDSEEEIVESLRLRHLEHIDGIVEFFSCFNRCEMCSDWQDCRRLQQVRDYFAPQRGELLLPSWEIEAYREKIDCFKMGTDFSLPPTGVIVASEWWVLLEANKDFLAIDRRGKLAWLIGGTEAFLIKESFDEFLLEFARLVPREGTEFMWDFFGDTVPLD